ncbi:MAG: hypothetical protein DRG78_17825 [Epsilonproteobacteria bacterium]|nr:MAG: hypothetical protein DRG78_17825 [Campylobacterota bacterium]
MIEPVISPTTTAFVNDMAVNIFQSQGYDIYYRLNGTAPQQYNGTFNLTETTSLVAYASAMIDGVVALSDSVSATYTLCRNNEVVYGGSCVEYEAPVMNTPTATPMEPEFTDSVTVSLVSPDGGYLFYSIDGGSWIEYSGSITLTESATIYAYADSDPLDPNALISEYVAFSYSKVESEVIVDPNSGQWVLSDTIIDKAPDGSNTCYNWYSTLTSGSYSGTSFISTSVCNWKKNESITFTASWSPPPPTLVPDGNYTMSANISRSNPVTEWGADDYIGLNMDQYDVDCGFGTASSIGITDGWMKVGWRASNPSTISWSGSFEAPSHGYAGSGETNKFQIKTNTRSGCVRYIYEWSN